MTKFIFFLLSLNFLFSCSRNNVIIGENPEGQSSEVIRPKNIILLIGDGMGLTQISAGTFSNGNSSHLERMKVIGIHKPYASNKLITDSAAGATAFACGIKTFNGAIGMTQDSLPVMTILEEAEQRGLSTGLIATSSITHATPASFIAHNTSRKNYEAIAADFLTTEIDFFVGGGMKYFGQREEDDRDLISELKSKQYVVENFIDSDIKNIDVNPDSNFVYFSANKEPLPVMQDRDYLLPAIQASLSHLKQHSDSGFFLMVEGSQIDWGGHANSLEYVVSEWKEFNKVIGQVLDWAEDDGETLVVVTADHETGGLAIQQESKMDSIVASFTSDNHTGTMIPVFADGPCSEYFSGIYENTDIYYKMKEAFGWDEVPAAK